MRFSIIINMLIAVVATQNTKRHTDLTEFDNRGPVLNVLSVTRPYVNNVAGRVNENYDYGKSAYESAVNFNNYYMSAQKDEKKKANILPIIVFPEEISTTPNKVDTEKNNLYFLFDNLVNSHSGRNNFTEEVVSNTYNTKRGNITKINDTKVEIKIDDVSPGHQNNENVHINQSSLVKICKEIASTNNTINRNGNIVNDHIDVYKQTTGNDTRTSDTANVTNYINKENETVSNVIKYENEVNTKGNEGTPENLVPIVENRTTSEQPSLDDRAAFTGDQCPENKVKLNNTCVDAE